MLAHFVTSSWLINMGNCCGKQLSDYQRDNVLLDIQSNINTLTVTVNSISSTCNGLENRLFFIRESTFQALQVVKTNLEKVNDNVKTIHTGNRHSQRLQFLDLDNGAYNFPRPTPPTGQGNRPLPPIKQGNPPRKREHTYCSMGEAKDEEPDRRTDKHSTDSMVYVHKRDALKSKREHFKSTDHHEYTKEGARPKHIYVNQASMYEDQGACAQPYDPDETCVKPLCVPRSDRGTGKLTSTITLTKINSGQDDVALSDSESNTVEYNLKVDRDMKHS